MNVVTQLVASNTPGPGQGVSREQPMNHEPA